MIFWWDRKETRQIGDDPGQVMVAAALRAESNDEVQYGWDVALKNAQMYENEPISDLRDYGGRASRLPSFSFAGRDGMTWNVYRSVVDTLCAQVFQTRVRPRVLTNRGRFKSKRNSRKMTTLLDGMFAECNLYEKAQAVGRDSCLFRQGGWIQVMEVHDRVDVERVLPTELFFDPADAIYGNPRTLYRRRLVDRAVLLALWANTPAKKEAVRAAMPSGVTYHEGKGTDKIKVLEAWHLPTLPGKDGTRDGRHMIAIEGAGLGCTLVDREWQRKRFPILPFLYSDGITGVGGQTLGDVLRPMQVEVNRMLLKASRVQRKQMVPYVAVPRGSKVTPAQLDGDIGHRIDFSGNQAPVFNTPDGLPPEFYAMLERHVDRMYSLPGISRDFARGTKEQSLTAAVAIQESLKIQDNRMALLQQRWERFFIAIAREMVATARDVYERSKSYRVSAPGTSFLESVDWKEIDLDEDMYEIGIYGASLLPTEPGERKQQVIELVEKGVWSAERGEAALDDMDPDDNQSLESAATRDLERMLDGILYERKYEGPEPWMDLKLALKTAVQYMHMGRAEGAPTKNLNLINKFMDEVKGLQKKMASQTAAAAPAAPVLQGGTNVPTLPGIAPQGDPLANAQPMPIAA